MKKEKILRLDLALQISLLLCLGITILLECDGNSIGICFFSFAAVQVLFALITAFRYKDKRKKKYLKYLFWINGVGTGIAFLFGYFGIGLVAYVIFLFCWVFCPVFLAIWALINSVLALNECEQGANEQASEFV